MKLHNYSYGKARVRLLKVIRRGRRHSVKDLEATVMLRGDFERSYVKGDNSLVVPTDTIKNTVNLLAHRLLGQENEDFALALAQHFLSTYAHVSQADVRLVERRWERMAARGYPHPHSFIDGAGGRPIAEVSATRKKSTARSGIEELIVLKTTGSGFEGFLKDEATTLLETKDRLLCTKINATWTYARPPKFYGRTNVRILDAMLNVFAAYFSPSVQKTLFDMGKAALKAAPEISSISLALPNKHYLPIDLSRFGLANRNELFVPTEEPHGQIEGTVTR